MIYELKNVCFSYREGLPDVLRNVSLSVPEGGLLTILGQNGSGKSTLFNCMTGIHKPQSGQILLSGEDITAMSPKKIAAKVGYVPQSHVPTFAYSVFEFVLMGCASRVGFLSHPGEEEKKNAREAIERMDLMSLSDRPYTELSGGERQQVTIARAIAQKPEVILFDEPTSHLDFGNQLKVLRVIRDLSRDGYAVVVTTHDPNHALMLSGTTALFTGTGTVETGAPEEILTKERLSSLYGTELDLRYVEDLGRSVCMYPKF